MWLVLASFLSAHAVASPTGEAMAALSPSVRQAGMGDINVGANDLLAGWTNPAALGAQQSPIALSLGGAQLFGGTEQSMALGAGYRSLGWWSVGALVATTSASLPEVN